MCNSTAVSNPSPQFMQSVQSPMLRGGGSMLEGGDDDDDQAAHTFDTYNSSQTVFQTPPPPPTQETQTGDEEGLYGRGYRGHHPPARALRAFRSSSEEDTA